MQILDNNNTLLPSLATELFGRPAYSTPERIVLKHNGGDLEVLTWGSKDNPPVLCLHGGGQSAFEFSLLGPALADQYQIIALSYAGHGGTAWHYTQATSYVRTQIEAVRSHFDIERAAMIALSLGGLHGAHFARFSRGCISKLILGDITPQLRKGVLSKAERYYTQLTTGEIKDLDSMVEAGEIIAKSDLGKLQMQTMQLLHGSEIQGDYYAQYDPTLPNFINDRTFKSFWGDFENLRCPVLLLRPEERHSLVTDSALERFKNRAKDVKVRTIHDAGHNIVIDNPVHVARQVKWFLSTDNHS